MKPGAAPAATPQRSSVKVAESMQRLRKTGSVDDAARVFYRQMEARGE